ncbi:nucleoside diphosphate kinase regulator [Methylobacterium sp. Leaf94]|uniref:nucleoside diphosphate kinase regulator n=1 Tax=Methylobacterium sp. Leaf94 TaxID=1736250 RepID=UPI0006F3BB1E|nr:nucleoside diphosphate kinase regulator [Methylobacterium sp. Leaf94]KQU23048.1 nucleoside diphosphate kinase regulator [Methylobacterium sp. Leaf94]
MSQKMTKPHIKMTKDDHERLARLASFAADRVPEVASFLADEVDRAKIIGDRACVSGLVQMGGRVEFRDDTTGKVQTVTLVYPGEADIEQGRVSVLTPIGAALIGLTLGQSMDWQTRTGTVKRLTILDVKVPELV